MKKRGSGRQKPADYKISAWWVTWRLPAMIFAGLVIFGLAWPLAIWMQSFVFGVSQANTIVPTTKHIITPATNHTNPQPLVAWYDNVKSADDLAAVVDVAGRNPDHCGQLTSIPHYGTQHVCYWVEDDKTVILTLLDDQVIAKTKVGF